jgi:AraC-like DNA-binding protein
MAPSISERGRKLCEENGIGYVDLQGNAFVKFDGIFIKTVAPKKEIRRPGRPKSLFAPVSTRVVRMLLAEPQRHWKLKELAAVTHMSLGQVYKVKQELLNQEFIEADQKKQLFLKDPGGLLNAWRETYKYENNQVVSLFSLDKIPAIEEKIKQYCDSRRVRYAFTFFSGATKLAPFVRYGATAFYFIGDREELQRELNLKTVDSGANVLLFLPYDEGVLQGLQEVQGYKIVSTIQLYLDLFSYGGRGREQAEFLREKLIGF